MPDSFVAIQSHSPTTTGVFVRFDYRITRDRPIVLRVIEDTEETLIKVGDRLALPTDDVFFSSDNRKARAARFDTGVVTKRDLELLKQDAVRSKMFSIRSAAADEADGSAPLVSAEAKQELLVRENASLRQKVQEMEAASIAASMKADVGGKKPDRPVKD